MTNNTRSDMSENADMSREFAKQFADKASIAVDAKTPFASAEGIAKTAINEASESKVDAYESMIDFDRASKEMSMVGATEAVVDSGNAVLGLLDRAVKWVAKKLTDRGEKLVTRAQKQTENVAKVKTAREGLKKKQLNQNMENARLDEVNPAFSATRGLWGETGGRVLEWAGVKIKEITVKPYSEISSWGNHLEGALLNSSANLIKDGAEVVEQFAPAIKTMMSEKIGQRIATAQTNVSITKAQSERDSAYSKFTADVLQKEVDSKFNMPDAAAKSRTIDQNDGDAKHKELNKFTKEMTNRVTGQ